MLQRKQSLFLLTAMLLIISNLFIPFVDTSDLTFSSFELEGLAIDNLKIISTFPIAILISIIGLLNIIAVFMFKNRPLQMRLTMFALLLSVGFYGLLLFYHFMSKEHFNIAFSQYNYGLVTPLLAAVFDFMAFNGIRKDEKLIKDSDRFR